ncbi:hypothetical protein PBRA_005191 [Plasmodiophora brassicae]|uniref:Major facilitator superfamily associated domain-containing protein n=1 Tax=Plasmodiophora brassicae TaxID=37360 RepID=A0A0G4IN03_PLABS|nr:hypothetical protein PBRA_005191 [Plasmodiophora brassicae]
MAGQASGTSHAAVVSVQKSAGETDATHGDPQAKWQVVAGLILSSVFLQSLKPSDPYLVHYFQDKFQLTPDDTSHFIWPFYTFGYALALTPVAVLAEYVLDYPHVVVLGLLARVASQFILYYGMTLTAIQSCQALFGLASSTKIVNGALLYSLIPIDVFHRIVLAPRATCALQHSSATCLQAGIRICVFHGSFTIIRAGSTGWLLRDRLGVPYSILFHTSQASSVAGLILFACALSRPRRIRTKRSSLREQWFALKALVGRSRQIRLWSAWFWVGTACSELVLNMDTTLFKAVASWNQHNGLVLAAGRVAACGSALVCNRWRAEFDQHAPRIVMVSALSTGALLLIASQSTWIAVTHACIILFYSLQELSFCAASAQIAVRTGDDLRLVVLFVNTLLSLIVQSLIQLVLGPWALQATVRSKFACLGTLLLILAGCIAVVTIVAQNNRRRLRTEPVSTSAIELDSL